MSSCHCGARLVSAQEIKHATCVSCVRTDADLVAETETKIASIEVSMTKLHEENKKLKDNLQQYSNIMQAEMDGVHAFARGLPMTDNPHPTGNLAEVWESGWLNAENMDKLRKLESFLKRIVEDLDVIAEIARNEDSELAAKIDNLVMMFEEVKGGN